MTWAFARDGGLPFSRAIGVVVRGLNVPLVALIVASLIPIAFGAIYLGSSSALNAILSSSVVFLNLSYGSESEAATAAY
jgi:choline transport protein